MNGAWSRTGISASASFIGTPWSLSTGTLIRSSFASALPLHHVSVLCLALLLDGVLDCMIELRPKISDSIETRVDNARTAASYSYTNGTCVSHPPSCPNVAHAQ
jgi:hypothetical protein